MEMDRGAAASCKPPPIGSEQRGAALKFPAPPSSLTFPQTVNTAPDEPSSPPHHILSLLISGVSTGARLTCTSARNSSQYSPAHTRSKRLDNSERQESLKHSRVSRGVAEGWRTKGGGNPGRRERAFVGTARWRREGGGHGGRLLVGFSSLHAVKLLTSLGEGHSFYSSLHCMCH